MRRILQLNKNFIKCKMESWRYSIGEHNNSRPFGPGSRSLPKLDSEDIPHIIGFIQRQKVFWAPKTCSGSQGSLSVLPRPLELPKSALASSGHGIFHKAYPLINRFPRMFSGRGGGISFNIIDGCKPQAGRAPGRNYSLLLIYELHSFWPVIKVVLICPTDGIRISSS
jgi:hypothetical protein